MTTETRPASITGFYSTSAVDWIERNLVTEAMVDRAIIQSHPGTNMTHRRKGTTSRWLEDPIRRAKARRNIALGIRAGSYLPFCTDTP